MADFLDLARLVLAAGIAGCYACIWYVRFRHRTRDYPSERQWPGQGIDTTMISDRVHRLRSNYAGEVQLRPRGTGRRSRMVELTRRVVGRLPYFRRRASRHAACEMGAPTAR